jgi:O-antigen ligase
LHGRAAARLLGNLLRALVLGLALFAGFFLLLPWLTGVAPVFSDTYYGSRLGSVEARLYLWQLALSQIGQSPWLGVGPMHYAHHPNPEAAHPHNVYLQVAAEWGLPALLLSLLLAAMAMRRFHQRIVGCTDAPSRDVGIGLQMACIAVAIDGLFSGNFVMPVSQVWIAFTAGWAWAWYRGQSAQPAADVIHRSLWRQVPAWLLLASQVWLCWSVWPELAALPEYLRQAREQVPNLLSNPRFWSHGWF